MDRKVVIGLVGGAAAIIGIAVALHWLGEKSEEQAEADGDGPDLDSEIAEIGTIERDEQGMIKWAQFSRILFVGQSHGKKEYAKVKVGLLKSRRDALKDKDDAGYAKIVIEMVKDEEAAIQNKIGDIFEKIGLSDMEAQTQLMHHMQDESKAGEIMNITQEVALKATNEQTPLTKEVALKAFRRLNELQLESMGELMSAAQQAQNAYASPQDQQNEMNKMMILSAKLEDKLFIEMGVEGDQISAAVQKLLNEKDPDFMQLFQQQMMQAQQKAMQQQMGAGGGDQGMFGGMGGGPPGMGGGMPPMGGGDFGGMGGGPPPLGGGGMGGGGPPPGWGGGGGGGAGWGM